MYSVIHDSLDRQDKGLQLLSELLDEEFHLLMGRKTPEIMTQELSIHELLRQLAAEKMLVKRHVGGGKVRDYAAMLADDEQQAALLGLLKSVDQQEQLCSRRAAQNAELSLALLDQSRDLLTFLHKSVQPQAPASYGRKGAYTKQPRPEAAIISGRL